MSLVLRPNVPASLASRITQVAAVGVAKTLWGLGIEARIKWPNDLLVLKPGESEGRKICGILAESSVDNVPVAAKGPGDPNAGDRRLDFIVLGVADRAVTTIRSELGRDVDLAKLLGALLSNLDAELERIEDFGAVLDDWRALNCTLGKPVRVQRFGKVLEGRAVDLTPEGALLLETPEGIVELFEGEIEHLQQEGA